MPRLTDHQSHRSQLCLFCFGKSKKFHSLKDYESIKELLPFYNEQDDIFPTVLCTTCDLFFNRYLKDKSTKTKENMNNRIVTHDIYPMQSTLVKRYSTRQPEKCDCLICIRIRSFFHHAKIPETFASIFSSTDGNERKLPKKRKCQSSNACLVCGQDMKQGKSHHCRKANAFDKALTIIKDNKLQDRVVLKLVAEKACRSHKIDQNVTINSGNRQLELVLRHKKRCASSSSVIKLQKKLKISDNKRKILENWARSNFGKNNIESNIQKQVDDLKNSIQKYFESKIIEFMTTKKGICEMKKHTVVYCKDIEGVISYIKSQRHS